jgi:hypothetical protein
MEEVPEMLLAIDCGNTFRSLERQRFIATWRATSTECTADQYYVWLTTLMRIHQNIDSEVRVSIHRAARCFQPAKNSPTAISTRPSSWAGRHVLPVDVRVWTRPLKADDVTRSHDLVWGDLIVVDFTATADVGGPWATSVALLRPAYSTLRH